MFQFPIENVIYYNAFVLFFLGPDICGPGTKKVHVIFNYKGKNLLCKKEIRCKDDVFTHLYTLIVNPDNSYVVKIDNEKVESGQLEEDWDFLPPKKIKVRTEYFLSHDWIMQEHLFHIIEVAQVTCLKSQV